MYEPSDSLVRSAGPANQARLSHGMRNHISTLLLSGLLVVVVFDPSDSLSGLKKYFFVSLMIFSAWLYLASEPQIRISVPALVVALAYGVFLPTLSIFSYYLQGGHSSDYEGLSSLIGFFSLMLLIVLKSLEWKASRLFIKVLDIQAMATAALYVILNSYPDLIEPVTIYGYDHGFLWINQKEYGSLGFLQIFFKTAPFMVFPAAYHAFLFFSGREQARTQHLFLLVISCLALLISGTRANIVFAFIIPAYFAVVRLERAGVPTLVYLAPTVAVLLGLLLTNSEVLSAMLDPNEFSNSVKLGYWEDYGKIFTNGLVLFFGQGIGVIHHFESLGLDLKLTELTLFELVRNFGLLGAIAYVFFWLAPLYILRKIEFQELSWMRVAYACYLVISMSNYFILSSTGMVLMSIIYANCLYHGSGRIEQITVKGASAIFPPSRLFSGNR
jgi:hypothetical protein